MFSNPINKNKYFSTISNIHMYFLHIRSNYSIIEFSESGEICLMSASGSEYVGRGMPTTGSCVPWTSVAYIASLYGPWFPDKTLNQAANYCRNPDNRKTGPWCVSANTQNHITCDIPRCGKQNLRSLIFFKYKI